MSTEMIIAEMLVVNMSRCYKHLEMFTDLSFGCLNAADLKKRIREIL